METFDKTGGVTVEKYSKPCLASQLNVRGIIPLAAAIAGVSAVEAAFAAGAAAAILSGSDDANPCRAGLILQEA